MRRKHSPRNIGRAVRLVLRICQIAGAPSLIDDGRVNMARYGVIAAVRRHNTPVIFDWLIDALSYQGVSDSIAYGYMEPLNLGGPTIPPPFCEGALLAEPAFNLYDQVDYRWSASGPFIGEARVIELLRDGRYRLERLDGTPFPKEASIFGEGQLRLQAPVARSA